MAARTRTGIAIIAAAAAASAGSASTAEAAGLVAAAITPIAAKTTSPARP